MEKQEKPVVEGSKTSIGDIKDINTINTNYLRTLQELCNVYGSRIKTTRHYKYYDELSDIKVEQHKLQLALFFDDRYKRKEENLQEKLLELNEQAKIAGGSIRFEKVCSDNNLTKDELIVLAILYFKRFDNKTVKGLDLLRIAGIVCGCEPFHKIILISPTGTLQKSGLIDEDNERYHPDDNKMVFEKGFRITKKAFSEIAGIPDLSESEDTTKKEPQSSILLIKDPEVTFDNLVLSTEIKNSIEDVLWQYEHGEQVYEKTGLKQKLPYGKAMGMLFYGPPGTGKTATCEAIAKQLNKKIAIVCYDKIYSMWVGGSEKHLVEVFKEAKQNDSILVFDEAESLFSRRLNERHSTDRTYNLMTNILMQEVERYSGLLILTTNHEMVLDEAFERRIQFKLKFDLPPINERAKIWQVLLKDCPNLGSDVSNDGLGRYPLAGGNIKNVVVKVIMKCAKENRNITMSDLIPTIEQETKHKKTKEKNIGF